MSDGGKARRFQALRWSKEGTKGGRTPHPDARIEAELQKVLMLLRLAAGCETQIQQCIAVLDDAQETMNLAVHNSILGKEHFAHISAERMKQAKAACEQCIIDTDERISALRGEVRHVHEEIGELIAKLSDTDLAFLELPDGYA